MVERLREVVIGGDAAGWWMMVVVEKTKNLFVHDVHMSFRQTLLTQLSIKRRWSLSHNITNLSHHAPFIY